MTVLYVILLCACGGVYVDVCELCMCVRVFKCSDVMVSCYEQFHINKPLLKIKTSVLYNKRVASKICWLSQRWPNIKPY